MKAIFFSIFLMVTFSSFAFAGVDEITFSNINNNVNATLTCPYEEVENIRNMLVRINLEVTNIYISDRIYFIFSNSTKLYFPATSSCFVYFH